MILETKRLILRPPKESDWKDIVEGANDIAVAKNLLVLPYPYHKKHAIEFIKLNIKHASAKKTGKYEFFIELKKEHKIIGVTAVYVTPQDSKVCSTGSWINKKYWRKGYILEAKVPVLDFAFNKLKMRKIETSAFVENTASNNMSLKLGFKLEGTKRHSVTNKATGKVKDENIYGMLKSEWKERRPFIVKEVQKKIALYG